jgi:hypothetical protein
MVAIRNGTFATVVAVPGDLVVNPPTREGDVPPSQGDVPPRQPSEAIVVELASGQQVALSSQYLEESTSLGYAMTVFRSQGITVDHAFLLGNDTLFQEAGYTALSRGRLSNHLYAVASENPRAQIAHGEEVTPHQDALAGLVDALSRSHEQTMALESLPAGSTGARTTADGERSVSGPMGEPLQPSVEEWFQRFGRDLARNEERAHETPTPDLSWSYDDDLSYGRDYDDGFGL